MKAVLISIRPEWVAKILNGDKTIEIRKTAPKCDLPIDVYIYCTKGDYLHHNKNGWFVFDMPTTFIAQEDFVTVKEQKPFNGKVVAKFTLREVEKISYSYFVNARIYFITSCLTSRHFEEKCCLTQSELDNYLKGKNGYAWHISDLQIFDEPKELSEFNHICPNVMCDVCKYGDWSIDDYLPICTRKLIKSPQSFCYVEEKQ